MLTLAKIAAQKAGEAILSVYEATTESINKEDGSPLTIADQMAHYVIHAMLSQTEYPVVSEEGDALYLDAKDYWLVDPLDGTKDFLAHNGQFTVNIALMKDNHPVLGVIYAPALNEWFSSDEIISPAVSKELRMSVSNFHDCDKTGQFAVLNHVVHKLPMGSSLKFGRMAKGLVDVYPRFVGTSEWDTAAGHAILEANGGAIIDMETQEPLKYGKGPKRLNKSFIALRSGYALDQFILP